MGRDSIDPLADRRHHFGLAIVGLFMIIYYRLPGLMSLCPADLHSDPDFALQAAQCDSDPGRNRGFHPLDRYGRRCQCADLRRFKEVAYAAGGVCLTRSEAVRSRLASICDSNISSNDHDVCFILFGWPYTGASIITGFALTLFIGAAVSMFTAITVTRTFLRQLVRVGLTEHPWLFAVIEEHPKATARAAAD